MDSKEIAWLVALCTLAVLALAVAAAQHDREWSAALGLDLFEHELAALLLASGG